MPKKSSFNNNILEKFVLNIGIVILLALIIIFIGIFLRNRRLIENQMLASARAYFNNIVITRSWNAGYGGVYVEKKADMESSPYINNPDIFTKDGKIFTIKNPALMTREISEIAQKEGLYQFHITSMKPINPKNIPDSFETNALRQFEKGIPEVYSMEKTGNQTQFRYIAPLITEENCLKCHAGQGYKIGEIRGGISVSFDISKIVLEINFFSVVIIIIGILTILILFIVIYLLIKDLTNKLTETEKKLLEMAIHDELTGLYNRRYFHERFKEEVQRAVRYKRNISILFVDIDHFKKINDIHGHHAGDFVLKKLAQIIIQNNRIMDVTVRYGGEEFIIMLPEIDRSGALIAAEKLRKSVEDTIIVIDNGKTIRITISIGISFVNSYELKNLGDKTKIIQQSDEALSRAKETGRNKIMIYE